MVASRSCCKRARVSAADLLTKPMTDKLPSDAEGLKASFAKVESVIAQTAAYVNDVVVRASMQDVHSVLLLPSVGA